MYPLIEVADEILRLSKREERSLTPMQLMKLSYISFGWYIANFDKRLFPERIEAWRYGPVMPDLYHATKTWGRDPIPLELIGDERQSVDQEGSDFLALVLKGYGQLSGIELSRLTHKRGSPWHQVYRPGELGIEIPEELICKHYKDLLDEAAKRSTA